MKKLCAVFLLISTFLGTLFADLGGFYIKNYNFHGTLLKNNKMEVTENIDVHFNEERHGIYHYITEYVYVNREGKVRTYKNQINKINVKNYKFKTDYEDGNLIIKIGDENKYVSGDQHYEISYVITMPDDRIRESDFLFYSVLGSGWNVQINHFNFRIDFEKPLPNYATIRTYSGEMGDEGNTINVLTQQTSTYIHGEADSIPPENAITLFTDLPDGYYEGAYKLSPFLPWLLCILAILAASFTIYKAVFHKRKLVVPTVEFYPPEGISSAEVGYIIDSSADVSDLLSLIPEWANKGYISITEEETKLKTKKITLTKLQNLPETAPEYQIDLFKALFRNSDTCNLSKLPSSTGDKIVDCCTKLSEEFTDERELYKNDILPYALLILTNALYYLAGGTCSTLGYTENIGLFFGPAALVFAGWYLIASQLRKGFLKKGRIILNILIPIAASAVNFGMSILITGEDCNIPAVLFFISTAFVNVATIIACKILERTDYGAELAGKLLGLKQFIQTVETPRLEVLMKENTNYYFDLLPYAMVFGLADKWAKKFEKIHVEKPDWYYSSNTLFNTMYFNRIISEHVSTPITSSATAAKKAASSSSSGGYSGGGSGGGGGGSW